jgi:hypothetical protein
MSKYETISVALQVMLGLVAIATLILYYRQLRVMSVQLSTMQESSRAQSGLSLVAFLQAPEVRTARHVVRDVLSKKSVAEWSVEERLSASLVVSNYDVAAALIRSGLAPVELITANWGPSITHCYQVLKPFIDEQRGRPGGNQNYWSNFEWLNNEASKTMA